MIHKITKLLSSRHGISQLAQHILISIWTVCNFRFHTVCRSCISNLNRIKWTLIRLRHSIHQMNFRQSILDYRKAFKQQRTSMRPHQYYRKLCSNQTRLSIWPTRLMWWLGESNSQRTIIDSDIHAFRLQSDGTVMVEWQSINI